MSIYSLSNNIILSQILSPYYKLTISAKLYPLFLINYTAALNEVLNISMTVTDNSTIPNSDSYNVTGLTFNSSCTPTYFNFSTRNINEQSITLSINPSFTNTAQNFSNGLVGLAELFIQVYRCSDDCRICANSNFCLECKQLFVSNNQCVDSCGGLFEFYIPNGDVNNFTSKACLSACPTTFYANISSAIFICLPCQSPCVTCRSNSQCSSCASPYLYYSQNFSCLMSCPLGYYSKNGSCLQCNTPCKTCSNETACTSCSIGFFDGSGCVALCSPGTFEQQLTSTCVQCSPTCLTCSINPLNCLSCPSGLALYGSTCVLACPANGYYLDNTTGNCIACRSPCLNCLSISTCLSCLTGYLQNNTCLSNCPTKYYSETSNNTCVACINNCLTCASTTICQSCLSGYYLYQSSCVITCPNLYYQIVTQSNNGLCSPCLLPCANCLSSVLCLTCQTGFLSKLQNNTCLTLCEDNYFGNFTDHTCVKCLSPCLTCTSATSCLMCLPSVTNNLLQGNTCVSVCNSGYYNQSMMCLPCLYPCITCNTTATGCLSCSQPFLLRGQDCVSQCMSGEYPFNNIQCVNCTGDCQTCTDATTCLSCVSVISGVQKYLSGSVCLAICPNKTFADSITLQCRACVFPCLTCIDILNCNTCQIGFLNVQTNRCDFCTSTEYSDTINQQCVTCNSSLNNCSTCINSTWCTSCQANFYLYSGKCISAADCNQILSYYLNIQQSACLQCVAPCQYCTSQIVCLSCLTGFLIESNQTCGHSCPIMFYADSSTKVCQPCNSTVCRTCTNTANTCLDCFNNSDATKPNTNLNFSILFNRTCINQSSCPTEYYIDFTLQTPQCLACVSPCRECTSVSVCLNCWSGILQNSTCVTNCSSGSFSIVSNGMLTCQTCDPSCLTCMNISTYCLSCQTRKFIQTGSCVTNCSNIFYYDPNTLSCLPCRSPCATCSSIINCITCLNSLYLYYGQCVQICPDGSYPDSSTNQSACLSCPSICSKCKLLNGSVVCTTCSNSKFMISTQPGQCLTACPDGWYADFGTYQCYQCQTPCVTCSAATQCTTCISGYLIYHTDCLLGNECPDGTYLQPSAPICNEVCYAPYYANPPTKTCELICSQNYLMTNNQTCVLACPTDYYIDRNMTCQNCYDSTGSYLQQCKSLLTFTIEVRSIFNKLFLQVTFTQPYGYITPDEIQVSYSKLIASRLLADQTTMAFSLQSSTDTTLTLELLPTGSITSEMIEMQLSKYIITDQFVLQNLYSTYMLNQYDLYDIPDGLDALEAFGKAICIITTLAFLAALLFNVGCVLYPLINCLQFLFLVLFCNVDFSPNLNHFLFGLRYLHFLYLPQIFSTQSSTSQSQLLRLSPNKFGSLLTDITFLGNTGPAFILLFIFIGVLLVCKLIDLLMIRPQRTVANAADT
jgi:proprotein convertase subtilisin/kexin type 5